MPDDSSVRPLYPVGFAFAGGLRRVLGVVMLAVLLRAGVVHADDTQRAKELFQQGTTLFNLGEFDKAIEAWQQGYKEKPDPGFLYNIGQAYRLKGDASKAIFFYRGYLRNSPKAPNRAEIEAKIATLQKEASEPKPAPALAPSAVAPPPLATPTPAPVPRVVAPAPRVVAPAPVPTPVAPPPVVAPPLAGPAPAPEVPAPMSEPEVAPADLVAHWSLSLGFGLDNWTSGLNIKGDAPAQGAFGLAAGYTFGGDVLGAASFRLGALLHMSTLSEGAGATANKISFTSALLEPSVRVRLVNRRLYLTGGLGLGVVAIGGLKTSSVVLDPKQKINNVNGTLSGFELRPAVGLELHFTQRLLAFVSPAISYAPKPQYFYQPLGRFELMFGLTYFL